MSLEIGVVETGTASANDYESVIDSSPDSTALHTLEWREVLRGTLGDPSYYFVCRDRGQPAGVLPAFIRTTGLGAVFNSLPLSGSYGGVCLHSETGKPREVFRALISRALAFAAESRCLTATFIMSPLRTELRGWYIEDVQPDFIYDRVTQFSDLTRPLVYKPSVRNHIRKSYAMGVTHRTEPTAENLDLFYSTYATNMKQIGLAAKPRAFFESIARVMTPRNRARFYFAFADANLVSGLLVLLYRNGVMCHETCFDRAFRAYQGNSHLLDVALKDARDEGFEHFNWGASENRDCGVYRFKQAWGATETGYSYFTRMVGDCSALRRAGAEEILRNFSRLYYVFPFDRLREG
ncbi:MAG: GNAT family N-acetyltransferase [bacterium]